MTLAPFDIILSLILLILASLPFIFLFYVKKCPEALEKYAGHRSRTKMSYILFRLLGFSIFCTYLIAYSIGFSIIGTNVTVGYGFGVIIGLSLSIWIMHALSKCLPIYPRSSFLISIIVFSILFALCLIGPPLMLSEPLLNANTVHILSLVILILAAFWMNSHPPKETDVPHMDEVPELNSTTTKIDMSHLTDVSSNHAEVNTTSTPVVGDAPAEVAVESISNDDIPQERIVPSKKKLPVLPRWITVIILVITCLLCITVGYLAGGGYLSESLVPNSPYIQKLKKAETDAATKGYKKGYRDGRNDGYNSGKNYGYEEGYSEGYSNGADDTLSILSDYLDY